MRPGKVPFLKHSTLAWDNNAISMSIRTLSTREIYRNPWLRLREDEIERSNGAKGIYSVVDKDDCAIILPIEGETMTEPWPPRIELSTWLNSSQYLKSMVNFEF